MKVLVFGANGTIGKAVSAELSQRHEVIAIGRQHGDLQVDFRDPQALAALFRQVGKVDAIVSAAGGVPFAPLGELDAATTKQGLDDKLMGQVNLVLQGQHWLNDGGSITLISGILSIDPIVAGSVASLVNGAVESFVRAAAIELPRGLRINAISPTVLEESMDSYGPFFRGFVPVPAARVAQAYSKSVEGAQTGQIYPVR
ncbi:short chain dehydrogenase [Paludibacterium sp. B53371]|uniref:short chain dehydrogenase n=1 Tax=Paludibacterium sp. B53371 TaxID=2806263 RepID=UPI001C04EF0A|nr:short chain dehydrogenase [Paludibacterium sp. B53371]